MIEQKRDVYLLARDRSASARLVFQHNAIIRMQGWLLHPDVKASVSNLEKARILDLATGNAIWAFDLADEFPNAEIRGIDISDAQYPPQFTWPSNVKLELGDLFAPVPEEYQGYFDVIHIRLIVGAIYTMDKDKLMQNILAMLKPGGYIQWDELLDPLMWIVDRNGNATLENSTWVKRMYKVANFQPACQWAGTLPEVFEKHRLEDVVGYRPPVKRSVLPHQTESLAWSCREIMNLAVSMGKPGAEEEFALAMKDIDDFVAEGYLAGYAWINAVGKKPVKK